MDSGDVTVLLFGKGIIRHNPTDSSPVNVLITWVAIASLAC